ncbi:MAG: class I SAM-dependent RNA methyltransferase [Candidatus Syntrophonatronum acetioxidans]|uniref:Class I SAM-dependent RNA methyltransferase n=1 Tax=Candidatus Syntrophonatronum acetioxidans TaxID=1795816 RepID=A0A424YBT9_9FIRM|nr:MAG: class I SAM-dependent RNA methyltransferase [Candidatus Syntrophonatronum acetioxidans]
MAELDLIATTTFGLEAVAKRELLSLGYSDIKVSDGRINFKADLEGIPRANLWLRSADRVLLQMGEFKALTFEELFEKTKALPWDEWITKKGKFTVNGKSVKSRLYSISDCQALVKKAVVEKLKKKYHVDWFEETGPDFTIQVALHKDIATLTIDTSGPGLHKRGYRQTAGEAPLKETLASAMVQLSFWNKERILLDPFCGSGTIPIEAALLGRNIAPGLNRNFASEEWPLPGKKTWKKAKVEAFHAIDHDTPIKIIASDVDEKAVKTAKENAIQAGVDDCIEFSVKPFSQVKLKEKYVVVVTNPPYGERMGSKKEIHELYREMGKTFRKEPTWSIYVLTPEEKFEPLYGGRAHRRRKLYSGDIKVDYYQFYGERPPQN